MYTYKIKKYNILKILITIISPAMVAYIGYVAGMYQFGGWDCSMLVNSGYQTLLGYEPYSEILGAHPPIFFYPAALALKIFGVTWRSLVLINSIALFFLSIIQILILKRIGFNYYIALLLGVCLHSMALLPRAYWWFNPITSSITTIYLSTVYLFNKKPANLFNTVSLIIALSALSLCKINIFGITYLLTFLFLIKNKKTQLNFILITIASTLLAFFILEMNHCNIKELIKTYFIASKRISNLGTLSASIYAASPTEYAATMPLFLPALFTFILIIGNRLENIIKISFSDIMYTLICISISCVGIITNSSEKLTESAEMLLGFAILWNAAHLENLNFSTLKSTKYYLLTSILSLQIFSIVYSISRENIYYIGPGTFWELFDIQPINNNLFFAGFHAGPRFRSTLNELDDILKESKFNVNKSSSIFLGPRMEFAYAAYNLIPPKNFFVSWPVTNEETEVRMNQVYLRFIDWKPSICIFLRGDTTGMPENILAYISNKYTISNTANLTICRLK